MKINVDLTESDHVGLNVADLERSERFCRNIFGLGVQLESTDHGGEYAFLTDAGRLILTLWGRSEKRFKKYRPGLHHLASHVASWDHRRRSKKVLERLGVHYRYDRPASGADGFMSPRTSGWSAKLREIIPSYGQSLIENPALCERVRADTAARALHINTIEETRQNKEVGR